MIGVPMEALLMAVESQGRGQAAEAEALCREIVHEHPDYAEAWHLLGILCQQQNRPAEAVQNIAEATKRQPRNANYWANLGQAMRSNGQLPQAEQCFRQAIECDENCVAAWVNLSVVLSQMARYTAAIGPARMAIALQPNFAPAHAALGEALSEHDPEAALEAFKKSLHLDPDQPDALNNAGAVLMKLGHYFDAITAFERAIELTPEFPQAWNNLGIARGRVNRPGEAMEAFERAVGLMPNYIAAHTNRATAWLTLGDFERGWREYEWRWAAPPTPEFEPRVLVNPLPPIDEKINLDGKTILIYSEQGFGDVIQFIRYVPLLARRGAGIVLGEAPKPLVSLLESVEGVRRVIPFGARIESSEISDYQVNLMTLPMLFRTTLKNIPVQVPYIGPAVERVRAWRERMGENKKLKVGLRWAGNPSHTNDLSRSLDPNLLRPLLANPQAAFYSLQIDGPRMRHENLIDFTEDLTDFAQTAALIANLDLIISVDTAVAHLAGAMGRPAWTLLPFGAEFRWLLNRFDSPWYPTMRLFRQKALHDWAGVIESVSDALENFR
jgi:tetratricopeptide (TPR) repeat protein